MNYLLKHEEDMTIVLSHAGISDLAFELGYRTACHGTITRSQIALLEEQGYILIDNLKGDNHV